MLSRSPGGLIAGPQYPALARSESGQSTSSSFSAPSPVDTSKRQSNQSAGFGEYYWSNEAGQRNGPSSSTSSLAGVPLSSSSNVNLNSPRLLAREEVSRTSLRDLVEQERLRDQSGLSSGGGGGGGGFGSDSDGYEDPIMPRPPLHSADSNPISNRRFHVVTSDSNRNLGAGGRVDDSQSPGGFSSDSRYSHTDNELDDSTSEQSFGHTYGGYGRGLGHRTSQNALRASSIDSNSSRYDEYTRTGGGESKRPLMEPSSLASDNGVWSRSHQTRESTTSTILADPTTPTPYQYTDSRPELQTPKFGGFSKSTSSPQSQFQSSHSQTTPRTAHLKSMSSHERMTFVAPPDVSRRSLDALEREVDKAGDQLGKVAVRIAGKEPSSAPAWRTEFGDKIVGLMGDEDEDPTIKGRKSALPSLSIDDKPLMEYERGRAMTPTKEGKPSPMPSPEPPPRSTLRRQFVPPGPSRQPEPPRPSISESPKSNANPATVPVAETPSFVHTTDSSNPPSRQASQSESVRSSTVPEPSESKSTTISDLADLLGGAIDEIGLIDSRHTPPPLVSEPPKKTKPNLILNSFQAMDMKNNGPITPSTLPTRGASLSNEPYTAMPTIAARRGTAPAPLPTVRKSSSIYSFRSNSFNNSPTFSPSSGKPWPAAMLFGHIKTLKNAGDRSKGYARGINDLARAESGLKEWCYASVNTTHRPTLRSPKMSFSSLNGRSANTSFSSTFSPSNLGPQPRTASSGSEFPMRADSYAAREISVRHIDPTDQPTALPPNLPYPQLQQQHLQGMKPSQSMQSFASVGSSSKKGFFSHLGRRGSGKKESALGPPSSNLKKDVRGLMISSPTYETSLSAPRVQTSISAPMGPRNPRSALTPDPISFSRTSIDGPEYGRGSLDTSLSALHDARGRGSLDSGRPGKWSSPPLRGSAVMSVDSGRMVRDEDVRSMADVLPNAERAVLRRYLEQYGEQMQAIGAYLEDEKSGTLLRV